MADIEEIAAEAPDTRSSIPFSEAFPGAKDFLSREEETPPEAEGAEVVEEDAAEVAEQELTEEEEAEWYRESKRRFGTDDPDELAAKVWQSYRELETAFSKRDPAAPAPAPAAESPPLFLPGDVQQIRNEDDLKRFAAASPAEAAMWAIENGLESTKPQLYKDVMNWWNQQDAHAYRTFFDEVNLMRIRNEWAQEHQVTGQFVQERTFEAAIERLTEKIPLFDEFRDEISAALEANGGQLDDQFSQLHTPEALEQALTTIFYSVAGPKLMERAISAGMGKQEATAAVGEVLAEAAEQAAAPTNRARTQVRNTADVDAEQTQEDAIKQMILNPSGRR